MDPPPFLLDEWTTRFAAASPPIAYNLASSTGPRWSLSELASLGGTEIDLKDLSLGYSFAEAVGRFARRSPIGMTPILIGSW